MAGMIAHQLEIDLVPGLPLVRTRAVPLEGHGWVVACTAAKALKPLRRAGRGCGRPRGWKRCVRLGSRRPRIRGWNGSRGWWAGTLGVPVALVSLAEADRQVFPGHVGLAEGPWTSGRQAPLAHSLCQRVAATGSPLVLADVRQDEQACGSAAIRELGMIAYAGMPLTDSEGHVLGSLWAIDTQPRATALNFRDFCALVSSFLVMRHMPVTIRVKALAGP